MRITLNDKPAETDATTAFGLRGEDEIIILNGFQITEDRPLKENDQVVAIKKGVMPERDELEAMLTARHSPGVHSRLKSGRVAIGGLGGLGSHVAVMLTRMGVGTLLLVDFDVVEPSNLNRQHYNLSHLAKLKTDALKSQLHEINPFIEIHTRTIQVTEESAVEVFAGYEIVVEAFDNPESKAALTRALLSATNTKLVAASGLAGLESANNIITRRIFSRLYIAGDLESAAGEGMGLMSPRVSVCAGHQANMVVRLLLGLEDA